MPSSKFSRRFRIQPVNTITRPGPVCQHGRLLAHLEWEWTDGRPWPPGQQTVELEIFGDGYAAYAGPPPPPTDHRIFMTQVSDNLGAKDCLILLASIYNAGNEYPLGEVRWPYEPLPCNQPRVGLDHVAFPDNLLYASLELT